MEALEICMIEYLKTVLRYFIRMVIVTLISYPFSVVIGLFNQIHPYMQSVGEFIFYYSFCIFFSYRRKIRNSQLEKIYTDNISSEKFSFISELIKTITDNKKTLIIDALAFWSLYLFSQATILKGTIFGLYNEDESLTLTVHILIMVTFPIFDMIVMLFVRKKWHKAYNSLHKDIKIQDFFQE